MSIFEKKQPYAGKQAWPPDANEISMPETPSEQPFWQQSTLITTSTAPDYLFYSDSVLQLRTPSLLQQQ